MILDTIENAAQYTSFVKNLDSALAFLAKNPSLALGKHVFNGGFVIAVEGVSAPIDSKDFEAHRDYADVMFVLKHCETVCFAPVAQLAQTQAYSADSDCALYRGSGVTVTVPAGWFYIMMPNEGHKPCIHADRQTPFIKYIIKCSQI